MIILRLNSDWHKVKQLLKIKYPLLDENDLAFQPGGEKRLVEKLSGKLNIPGEDMQLVLLKMKFMESVIETEGSR